jgi:hypothetical protein
MTDLRALASRPSPWFLYRQSSSYDRASISGDPFANGDFGKFVRTETRDGRKEEVMADLKGPGAVVRVWSANPIGTIRFYFDGEERPRLEADMAQLLSGRHPLFPDPYAYVAAQGQNLYFPLPYSKSLKVTWDGGGKTPNSGLYYVVGHRDYEPNARVETFSLDAIPRNREALSRTAKTLLQPAGATTRAINSKGDSIRPGGTTELNLRARNGGQVTEFVAALGEKDDKTKAWGDPSRLHNVLRRLRLRMSFDGATTVDVPLGDFFGSAPGIAPYRSLPIEVRPDGTLISRWVMPYRQQARIWVVNDNPVPVRLRLAARNENRPFTPVTYLFHAGWNSQTKMTDPRYHFTFLNARGEGRIVGTHLQVTNPVAEWWGEGDEKVYVDGESFPSLFGTGSEDYYGYAWCDPTPFSRPYHAQPPTENIGNFGQTANSRFHILDPIPFRESIRFDMEAWHWKASNTTYATTALWYAAPGGSLPEPPKSGELAVRELDLPNGVTGAIEGENLEWTVNGGSFQKQTGFAQLSRLAQFWWREPAVGSTARTRVPIPAAGRYELFANFCHNRDYGRFRVRVGDGPAQEIDFYQPEIEWKKVSLGTFDFPAGDVPVTFETLSPNPAAQPKVNLLGVDYFLLEPR